MPEITILPTTASHVRSLGRNLRTDDEKEITCLGLVAHHILYRSYRAAVFCKTALVDGEVAAIWGCGGTFLGQTGRPWLLTGHAIEKVPPLTVARIYKREAESMLRLFPVLVNIVDASYSKSIKLLEITGFTMGEPMPIGETKALFRKYEMRT